MESQHTTGHPILPALIAGIVACAGVAGWTDAAVESGRSGAASSNPPVVRLVEPAEVYWAGRITFVVAIEPAPDDPAVFTEFFIDGAPAGSASTPPWRLVHDFGDSLGSHRLSVVAHSRSGATGSLTVTSRALASPEGAEAELVLVPVSVRAENGEPVRNLTQTDFRLFRDGAEIPIDSFDMETTPVSLVLGIDTSASMHPYFPIVQGAVIRFLQKLPPFFSVSLFQFGETIDQSTGFTFDRDHLYYTVNHFKAEGSETALLQAARAATKALANRPGRRVVALFTDGEDSLVPEDEREPLARKIVSDARAAGVMIYFVGYGEIFQMLPEKETRPSKPKKRTGATEILSRIATETGGEFIAAGSSRRISDAFDRIASQLETQYTLGFKPAKGGRPKTWHPLSASVNRPGARVSCRPGYMESGSDAE